MDQPSVRTHQMEGAPDSASVQLWTAPSPPTTAVHPRPAPSWKLIWLPCCCGGSDGVDGTRPISRDGRVSRGKGPSATPERSKLPSKRHELRLRWLRKSPLPWVTSRLQR